MVWPLSGNELYNWQTWDRYIWPHMHWTGWVMVSQTHQANYILPSARHCVKKKIIKLFSHYVTSSRQYFHLNKELYEAMQIETLLQVSPHGNSP